MLNPSFRIASYLQYAVAAQSRYYIHSPFAYALVDQTLNRNIPETIRKTLHSFREQQRDDSTLLRIDPVGTTTSQAKQFSVSQLSKRYALPYKYGTLLYKLIDRLNPSQILETGTGTGFSSACLALGNRDAIVHTVEALKPLIELASKTHNSHGIKNIRYHQGELNNVLHDVCKTVKTIDAAYLDANHTYEATIRYFNTMLPFLTTKAFVIVDDIHWSKGMNTAWLELCRHPRVTLALDFYRLGVLFLSDDFSRETIQLYY